MADEPENRRQFYLVVPAFILSCVGTGAAARWSCTSLADGIKTTLAPCLNPMLVSLEDALDNVAIGLEITGTPHTNKFVAQVAA